MSPRISFVIASPPTCLKQAKRRAAHRYPQLSGDIPAQFPAIYRETGYNSDVIFSFKDEEARKIFERQGSTKLPADIQKTAYRKLAILHSAKELKDLQSFPGNRLEKLKGDRAAQYSIRINDRWRICFDWHERDVVNVEIVDYHG